MKNRKRSDTLAKEIGLKKYEISLNRFRELKYFCLQYDDKKRELNSLMFISSPAYDGQPHGHSISDTTAKKALRVAELKKDVELIEQCAVEADSTIYRYIVTNVTKGLAYEFLGVPMGKNHFYEKRRKFFWLLNKYKI